MTSIVQVLQNPQLSVSDSKIVMRSIQDQYGMSYKYVAALKL